MLDLSDLYLKKDPERITTVRVNEQNYVILPSMHKIPGLFSFGYTNYLSGNVDAWTTRHQHSAQMEITVLLKGSQVYEVDGQEYTLRGNQFLVLPANVVHCAKENPHMSTFVYFQIDTAIAEPLLSLGADHSHQLVAALREMPLSVYTSTPTINSLVVRAFEHLLSADPLSWYTTQSLLASVLHLMLCQHQVDLSPLKAASFADKVTRYIEANITQRITIEEMAKALAYSPTYMKKHFVHIFGMTPHHYITKKKIDAATKLLRAGHSVTYTAMELSFSSSTHFSTVFKRHMLVSPKAYCASIQPKE